MRLRAMRSGPVSLAHPSACSWQDCAWTEAPQGSEGRGSPGNTPGGSGSVSAPRWVAVSRGTRSRHTRLGSREGGPGRAPSASAKGLHGWGSVPEDAQHAPPPRSPRAPSGLTEAKCPQASNIMVNSVHTPNSPLNQERKWLSGPEWAGSLLDFI